MDLLNIDILDIEITKYIAGAKIIVVIKFSDGNTYRLDNIGATNLLSNKKFRELVQPFMKEIRLDKRLDLGEQASATFILERLGWTYEQIEN